MGNGIFCYNSGMLLKFVSRLSVAVCVVLLSAGSAHAAPPDQTAGSIELLEPLGTHANVPIGSGYQTFINYFNYSVGWIFQVAVGFTVVWVLIGGFLYMTSGNNQSRRGEAVSRITWAITGLLLVLFTGFILRTLNDIFFVP